MHGSRGRSTGGQTLYWLVAGHRTAVVVGVRSGEWAERARSLFLRPVSVADVECRVVASEPIRDRVDPQHVSRVAQVPVGEVVRPE
jgi:hypothetical protein